MTTKAPRQQRPVPMGNRPRETPHEYAEVYEAKEKCQANLAVRLYTQVVAGRTDWKRWAATIGDDKLIAAVDEAVAALEQAHKIAAPKEYASRRKPKEEQTA